MKITGKDLIELGWKPSKALGEALRRANCLASMGMEKKKILEGFSNPPVEPEKILMREKPLPLNVALTPNTEDEKENFEAVVRCMNEIMKVPVVEDGSVMPDACPTGGGITVGGVAKLKNAISPAMHSADICCSMYATFFNTSVEVDDLFSKLRESTRFGFGGRSENDFVDHPVLHEEILSTNSFLKNLDIYAKKHMADQGDGNHFAYIGQIKITEEFVTQLKESGNTEQAEQFADHVGSTTYALVTHHGSRGLGAQLYKRGAKLAEKYTNKIAKGVPKNSYWIDYLSDEGKEYWEALQYVSRWTRANHQAIHGLFIEKIQSESIAEFGNEHNFVWKRGDYFYHGKGATPAWSEDGKQLLGIVPLNMAREILLIIGNDAEKYLSFAPHGAGRNMSRTKCVAPYKNEDGTINEELMLAEVEKQTKDIKAFWYSGTPDLSECPIGYKDATEVKNQIKEFGLATVVGEITPLGCFMAGDQPKPWERKKRK